MYPCRKNHKYLDGIIFRREKKNVEIKPEKPVRSKVYIDE